MNKKGRSILIGLAIIVLFIAIDLITKHIAFKNFTQLKTYKCIPGLFRINLVENTGGAFGIMGGKMWFLITITVLSMGLFAFLMKDFDLKDNTLYSACLILIISGTIGNFIDRIFRGSVRDFLTFDFMNFPSFNFADMCMTFGIILLAFEILFGKTGKRWT